MGLIRKKFWGWHHSTLPTFPELNGRVRYERKFHADLSA
jgi:hypothetical protein